MVREDHRTAGDPFAGAPAAFLLMAVPFLAVGLVIEVCLASGPLDQPFAGFAEALHALLIAGAGGLMLLRAHVVREQRVGWLVLGLATVSFAVADALGAPADARPGSLLLLGVAGGVARGRGWPLVIAGLAIVTAGDALWLWQTVAGTYTQGTLVDALWPAGMLAIGAAAWQPSLEPVSAGLERRASLAVPAVVALGAAVVLAAMPGHPVTAGLALAALAVVLVRAALALRVAARAGALGVSRRAQT